MPWAPAHCLGWPAPGSCPLLLTGKASRCPAHTRAKDLERVLGAARGLDALVALVGVPVAAEAFKAACRERGAIG